MIYMHVQLKHWPQALTLIASHTVPSASGVTLKENACPTAVPPAPSRNAESVPPVTVTSSAVISAVTWGKGGVAKEASETKAREEREEASETGPTQL